MAFQNIPFLYIILLVLCMLCYIRNIFYVALHKYKTYNIRNTPLSNGVPFSCSKVFIRKYTHRVIIVKHIPIIVWGRRT